ncbi:MAG: PIN domain-containing protein [Candidatus Paceibacterota bacterium]
MNKKKKNIKKPKNSKNYIFIDTNIFVDMFKSDNSEQILANLVKHLNKKNRILILPEVIKKEIEKEFKDWEENSIQKIKENLEIKKILASPDAKEEEKNINLVDKFTKNEVNNLIIKIKDFYSILAKNIEKILKHENTIIVKLTDKLILSGMKRFLLKKAPYTKPDKKHEKPKIKDVDCIAFESLLSILKEKNDIKTIFLCVKDYDYFGKDNVLSLDILNDLIEFDIKNFDTVEFMLLNLDGKKGHKTIKNKIIPNVKPISFESVIPPELEITEKNYGSAEPK